MERVFDIDVVNKFGDGKQYAQLIAYIDPFVKAEHPDALAILGICYDFGYGVNYDFAKALELYKKSAVLNSIYGQFHYGWYVFCFSKELDLDQKIGVDWIMNSAKQGSISAQFELGRIFDIHYEDKEQAEKYYQQAAEGGDVRAQRHLGDLYCYLANSEAIDYAEKHKNKYTAKNIDEFWSKKKEHIAPLYNLAIKWLKIAAEKGDVDAQALLGQAIHSSNDDTPSNMNLFYKEGLIWLERAGENPPPHQEYKDASWLSNWRKERKAVDATLQIKEDFCWLNYDRKMFLLSNETKFSRVKDARFHAALWHPNNEKSFYWWYKLLEVDPVNRIAHSYLGKMNFHGYGAEINYIKAFEHFNKVIQIDRNNIEALHYLALCYYNAYGTDKNLAKAFECFNTIAQTNTKEGCLAKYYLGLYYYNGEGVSKDKQKALELIKAAASIRNKDGKTDDDIARTKRFCGFDDEYFDKFDVQRLCGKACFFLGYLYETGKEFPQDISRACELYERGLGSSYSPTEMLSVRDMLMEPDPEENFIKQEMEWLQLSVEQAEELHKSKKALDSIIKDQTTISNTLDQFSKQLQGFVAEQKSKASAVQNPDDVDISITSKGINDQVHTYAQNSETAHDIIEKERQWLVNYFKDNCDENWWDKLDGYTRKSLISARFFLAVSNNSHDVDYSGACISASSALENELKHRFVDGYREYLDSVSSLSFDEWPSFMVDFKGRNGSKIKRDRFSLGDSNHICDTARDIQYFKTYLDTIKRNEFADKPIYESVNTLLNLCADRSFLNSRNRAGHTETTSLNAAKKQLDTALGRLKELVWLTTNPMIK